MPTVAWPVPRVILDVDLVVPDMLKAVEFLTAHVGVHSGRTRQAARTFSQFFVPFSCRGGACGHRSGAGSSALNALVLPTNGSIEERELTA
jgi:hypothetical protein